MDARVSCYYLFKRNMSLLKETGKKVVVAGGYDVQGSHYFIYVKYKLRIKSFDTQKSDGLT